MANRYWVGGTATWDATAGSKWATTSGGVGGAAVPTTSDDVFFDASSGAVTITIAVASNVFCAALNCTGFTGTLTWGSSGATINATGSVTLVAGMTLTTGVGGFLSMNPTSGTVSLTSAGKTWPTVVVAAGATAAVQLADAISITTLLRHDSGTLDTNGKTVTSAKFSSTGSVARTMTFGASQITLTSAAANQFDVGTTNLTVTANTATVTLNGAGAVFQSTSGPAQNWNGLTVVFSGSGTAIISCGNGVTLANLTRTGTAVKTDVLSIIGTLTVTSTLTLASNSDINRLLVQSSTAGTPRTITAASVVVMNTVDFMDITGAGAATWTVAGTGATALGDCGGNSGITFTIPATQTHTASAGGNWSDVTKWTSRVPLPQDNVIVDANTTGTLTGDMPRLGASIDFTGFAGTWSVSGLALNSSSYGSLTLVSGMTFTTANNYDLGGRGSHTLTNAGKTFTNRLGFVAPGGTYALQDAVTVTGAGGCTVTAGTLTTNNNTITTTIFFTGSGFTSTLNLGTSTINLTSTLATAIVNISNGTTTVNAGSATFVITSASTNARQFNIGAKSIGTVTYTVVNSPGALTFFQTGNPTITTLNVGSGRGLSFQSATTTTVTNWNVSGVNNGYTYFPDGVTANHVNIPDSVATSVTGDLDIRLDVALDTWNGRPTTGALQTKGNFAGQYAWNFGIAATGALLYRYTTDGTTLVSATSTATIASSASTRQWVRVTHDVDDGAGHNLVKFWTSPDGITWNQLGTTATLAGTVTRWDSTSSVITPDSGGYALTAGGKYYRSQVRNNILDDGTGIVMDIDFTSRPFGTNTFTESSTNAATVTVTGVLAQVGDGRVALTSSTPGSASTLSKSSGIVSSNYLTIQDSTATGGASWHALSSVNVSNNTGWIFTSPPSIYGNFTLFGGPN